jgi:hypothetical protein
MALLDNVAKVLTWRTMIDTSLPALIASIAALLAPLLYIATLFGSPFAPMALSKKHFVAAMSRFAVSRNRQSRSAWRRRGKGISGRPDLDVRVVHAPVATDRPFVFACQMPLSLN